MYIISWSVKDYDLNIQWFDFVEIFINLLYKLISCDLSITDICLNAIINYIISCSVMDYDFNIQWFDFDGWK